MISCASRRRRQVAPSNGVGGLTSSAGYGLADLTSDLVPSQPLHFATVAYAPLVSASTARHQASTATQLTINCLDPANRMAATGRNDVVDHIIRLVSYITNQLCG